MRLEGLENRDSFTTGREIAQYADRKVVWGKTRDRVLNTNILFSTDRIRRWLVNMVSILAMEVRDLGRGWAQDLVAGALKD